jgi:hypothetical protein
MPAPLFDLDTFWAFCMRLTIYSKDFGVIPLKPQTTQLYLLDQITKGLGQGKHHFVILKCRQAMASTICLALDLFWAFTHAGMIGAVITDSEPRRVTFRDTIHDFVNGLPEGPDWKQPITADNQYQLCFGNGSKLNYANANQRTKGAMGRGIGLTLVHGTEVGWWGDVDSYQSLTAAMAQRNPARLFLFESTANGMNLFHKMWNAATRATTQSAIFIGWWIHDEYQKSPDSPEYKTYWDGRLNYQESQWVDSVRRRFGYEVTPERIAWWRWMQNEMFHGKIDMLQQEYPWLPELAFQFSGSPFVSKTSLVDRRNEASDMIDKTRYFRFRFGRTFTDTELEEVDGSGNWYDLAVWQEPEFGEGVVYAIGGDPAHGANDKSDHSAICVWRCYADGVEQVAEFAMRGLPTYQMAWVILYLAGAYSNCLLNIEQQGGGAAVFQEIGRVQMDMAQGYSNKLGQHFRNLQHYVYRRADSLHSGYTAYHWQTNQINREKMLNQLRDFFERGVALVYSIPLINELATFVRTPEGDLQAQGDASDDRVMAASIGLMAYIDNLAWQLGGTQYTYGYFEKQREARDREPNMGDLIDSKLQNWIKRVRDSKS